MVKENTYLKGNVCISKGFMDVVLHFDIGVEEKPHVPRFGFCHVLSPFNKREGIHDSVSVTRIAFKD